MRVGFNTDLYSRYGDYQSRIKQVDVSDVAAQEAEKQTGRETSLWEQNQEAAPALGMQQSQERKPVELQDISTKFHRNDTYDYIGKDSAIESLDVQKAVSDMRKDSVLQEYQYFVGSAQALLRETQDGIVIPKPAGLE